MTCILTYKGDRDRLKKEVESVKKVDPSFPLICLTRLDLQEAALPLLMGTWDMVIPRISGWEVYLEKELRKLAEMEDRELNYRTGGCILGSEKSLKAYNYQILEYYLEKYDGSVYEVAKRLDIGKSTIYRMLKEQKAMSSQ